MSIYWEIPDFQPGLTLKVELLGCQFGVHRSTNTPVGQANKREPADPVTEINVTREVDKYSPLFYQEAFGGKARKMTIYFIDPKAKKIFLTVTLSDAMIANYQFVKGGDKPLESMSINFTKITYKYDPGVQSSTQPSISTYDLLSAP